MKLFLILTFISACHTGRDNQGKEFIIGFIDNKPTGTSLDLELFVTTISSVPCIVNITTPGYNDSFFLQYELSRRTIQKITLPSGLRGTATSKERKSIWIQSTEEITVYADNRQTFSTDAFIALPVDILGTEYYAITYKTHPEIMIVGTENGTNVDVVFPAPSSLAISVSYNGVTYGNGDTLTIILDRFDTFQINQVSTNADFTGSHIVSDKPIAVFSGNYKVTVPLSSGSSDHLVEQLTPVDTWGKTFSFVSTPARGIGDLCRILASEDSTTVSVSGMATQTIATAGQFVELDINTDDLKTISADKPVLVAAFSKSYEDDGLQLGGDPAMSLVVPNSQFASDYTFSTVETPTGEFDNYLVIVIADVHKADLRFDDGGLIGVIWNSIPDSGGLVAATTMFNPGAHNVYHLDPTVVFMAMASGVAQLNSYTYAAGLRLAQINKVCEQTTTVAGDTKDNDCDGKLDEETNNGVDDDGDGLVDEDLALPPRSDGSWAEWQSWAQCSLTCGVTSGLATRIRNCDNPAPVNNGLYCSGNGSDTQTCTPPTLNCPIDGNWTSWGGWAACDVTCDNGTVTRSRVCSNPVPQYGGTSCVGSETDVEVCSSGSDCPADGGWGAWSNTTACSTSCGGGLHLRSRTCNSPPPGDMGAECVGDYVNITACSLDPCPGQTDISFNEACPFRWFSCKTSRQCVHFLKRCDCVRDCPDNSDEDAGYAMCIPDISLCHNSADLPNFASINILLLLLCFIRA